MLRKTLCLVALLGGALAPLAHAQTPETPYKIHTITSIEKLEPNLYAFGTEAGQRLEVAASDAGIANDLLRGDAFSQDYHCALQPETDGSYRMIGCSGVGVPAPLRLP